VIADGALFHHLEGHPPRPLAGLRVAIRGPGEAEVIARAVDGGEVVLERVRPWRRGQAALALAEQWIAEAEQLALRQ
jgi:hypothetical protein